jgi:murein DD-endopeptidase MepM/ murein hydrolase activator NlpD
MAKRGTPVLSADDGKVIRVATNDMGGLTIYAADPGAKLVFYYAHLDRYAPGLKAGSALKKGQVIGFVGSSGNAVASAPHLHFQVAKLEDISRHWEGVPIDARAYFALDGAKR